ncbi:hypothetical protein TI05_10700 [Achromatium sp. WMS3]|nr:hypothetical protein TI05_10700 [Achromatium sp. WMS3]
MLLATPGTYVAAQHHHDHKPEHRHHGAHVHGIAALNIALEGHELYIELNSPAVNIIGFEHMPKSAADHAELDKAVATLKDGNQLFQFNSSAGCRMEHVHVTSQLLNETHHHTGHDHEHHTHETHADIAAIYQFECTTPIKLKQLNVNLFQAFPNTHKLKVQYVVKSKQSATKLTATNHVVRF